MSANLTRRRFVATAPVVVAAAVSPARAAAADRRGATIRSRALAEPPAETLGSLLFPSHDPAMVREIVGASHRNIERVRELLAGTPRLANASWDWGFGDWETPLGAASHVGRREIAELLLEHGARPDIFCLAMLGKLDAVRAMIEARPGLQRMRGPHGLTLMHHARAGGETSGSVADYLATLDGADVPYVDLAMDDPQKAALVGVYESAGAAGSAGTRLAVKVRERDKRLTIERAGVKDATPQLLFHQGEHVFHPPGAPEVRMVFTLLDGVAVSLRAASPGVVWEGARG